jgi:peroxiredoxin Q/BCP
VTLKVGDRAPAFTLKCTDGRLISLADYAGQKQVVLFFYVRDALERIHALNGEVLGISVDDVYAHRVFEKANRLNFLLLADTTKVVSQSYGVLRREGYNSRATFIVDKQGLLKAIFPTCKPESHIAEVMKSLKGGSAVSNLPKL